MEYTIYDAGEYNGSPYPCIVDSMGSCPYYYQRTVLRELLGKNGVWPSPSENTYQYIVRALNLPEDANAEIYGPPIKVKSEMSEENVIKFKKLIEWFVKQQKINGNVLPGKHVSGAGYKGGKIRNFYAQWRDYGAFSLDVSLQLGMNLGTAANYINCDRTNIIAEYDTSNFMKCDVVALKICINAGTEKKKAFPAVSIQALGLFDGQKPNEVLRKFFRDYAEQIKLSKGGGEKPPTEEKTVEKNLFPLNQILYGPPGTGKTYSTVCYAVAIANGRPIDGVKRQMTLDKESVFAEYRKLLQMGRVAFTTFHQSMGYEEFIEGIKPETDEAGNVRYAVKPGIFKSFCDRAKVLRSNLVDRAHVFSGSPTIWKVSLAGTGNNPVRQDCLEHGHIRIGWDEYGETVTDSTDYINGGKYILDAFINTMQVGDVILSCYSASTIDAIGIVTGDYEWHAEYGHYKRLRPVKWLLKNINENIVQINSGKQFTLSTVYKLNIAIEDVIGIINAHDTQGRVEAHYEFPDRYVFIIDEINRGNVSKIFGELITLIEENKRLGNQEEAQCILPYSGERFGVPKNVYLLGTMNTADRSLVQLDAALRRRFSFTEMMPQPDIISQKTVDGVDIIRMLNAINERISALVDREHQIGHAYFTELGVQSTIADLATIFRQKILPLLQEYFYEDYAAIGMVLSDAFIEKQTVEFRDDSRTIYKIVIPQTAEAYRSIYE